MKAKTTTAIYNVRHSEEVGGQFFSTLEKAEAYANQLMEHFGGEWTPKEPGRIYVKVYISQRIFRYACLIDRMSIHIKKIQLDQPEMPKLGVIGVYDDPIDNKLIHNLGIPRR